MTKTIPQLDAQVDPLADDDEFVLRDTSDSDDKKATSAQVKAYTDAYDNSTSGLSATNYSDAIDELSLRPNRNLLANGGFRVNQQGSASKTDNNPGWNYDTWYYDGTYLYTFVEEADIFDGDFTLSWESDATAEWVLASTSDGTHGTSWASVSNGGSFTLGSTSGNHLWVRFASGVDGLNALDKVQVEAGAVATAFEWRPYATDEHITQRVYELGSSKVFSGGASVVSLGTNFRVLKLAAPSLSYSAPPAGGTVIPSSTEWANERSFSVSNSGSEVAFSWEADARPPVADA
tara:strand:+ start:14784 stop:15656 length:873 start_codon:yes stop_codon:yes gene_type:complete